MTKLAWPLFFSRLLTSLIFSIFSCQGFAANEPPPTTVSSVDIPRYLGLWYEIASFPQWFQRNCYGVTAEYKLRNDGDISVLNRCQKGSLNGPLSEANGKAWAVDKSNSKLKVQFFWPFRGDYWILELGENYEYAVVGNPTREYLWILSRTPTMDETLYQKLLERLKNTHRYQNLEKLQRTPQKISETSPASPTNTEKAEEPKVNPKTESTAPSNPETKIEPISTPATPPPNDPTMDPSSDAITKPKNEIETELETKNQI